MYTMCTLKCVIDITQKLYVMNIFILTYVNIEKEN